MRGRFFAIKVGSFDTWFFPTLHPREVIDKAYNENKPLMSRLGHAFRMDIDRAFRAAEDRD
jgi:hypothetical protein